MTNLSAIRTPIQLCGLFNEMGNEIDGRRGVLVTDDTGVQVVHLDKRRHHFFTFGELVDLVDSFKEGIEISPVSAHKLSNQLKIMTERKMKKEAKQNFLIRTSLNIIQRIKNLFHHRGFLTTVGYAKVLIKRFDSLTAAPPPVERKPVSSTRTPLRRQSTVGKTAALETFKKDPGQCPIYQKTILFRDISNYANLCKLIKDFIGNSEVDFNDAWSRILVIEALKFVTKETSDKIIKQINFNPLLFCEILNLIIEKAADQKAFSLFSLELLMKTYISKSWYREELSLEDETLLKGIQLLIKSNPNMNPTTQLINWMIKDNKLTFKACVACMTSYLEKKWEKPEKTQITIEYPNLTSLEIYFKNQKWAPLADTVRHSNVRRYLENLR